MRLDFSELIDEIHRYRNDESHKDSPAKAILDAVFAMVILQSSNAPGFFRELTRVPSRVLALSTNNEISAGIGLAGETRWICRKAA